jgi:hypothetical protein
MILPYVYKLTHKQTGHFYFGYRCQNKVPASEDLGFKYFSSGKTTKQNFNDFDYLIIAEFFTADDAYWHEQGLIEFHRSDPLMLNKHYIKDGKRKFAINGKFSDEHKRNLSIAMKGRVFTQAHRNAMSIAFKNKPPASDELRKKRSLIALNRSPELNAKMLESRKNNMSNETRAKLSAVWKGRKQSPEHIAKLSETKKKPRSEKTKEAIRNAKLGVKHTTAAIKANSISHMKPCTIDDITIFPSQKDLAKIFGWGKSGVKHSNFHFVIPVAPYVESVTI